MERPTIFRRIAIITLISISIGFWPMIYVNDDSTGGGAAAFLMIVTIPAGIIVFVAGLMWSLRSHYKHLELQNSMKSQDH